MNAYDAMHYNARMSNTQEPRTLEEARTLLEEAVAIANDDVLEEHFTLGMLIQSVAVMAKQLTEADADAHAQFVAEGRVEQHTEAQS